MERIPTTREGYDKLREEIKQLEDVEMPKIAEKIADARAEGDLSENAEYHGQREARPLEEGPGVPHLREGGEAGGEAAEALHLRLHQRAAQLEQGLPPQHRAEEEPVGLQRDARLDQRAGQVVRPVERERGDDEVERGVGEGQRLFVPDHRRTVGPGDEPVGEVHRHHPLHALDAEDPPPRLSAVGAEVEGEGEGPVHVEEPVGQPLRHLLHQEGMPRPAGRRPLPVPAHGAPVEHEHPIVGGHRVGPSLRRSDMARGGGD